MYQNLLKKNLDKWDLKCTIVSSETPYLELPTQYELKVMWLGILGFQVLCKFSQSAVVLAIFRVLLAGQGWVLFSIGSFFFFFSYYKWLLL